MKPGKNSAETFPSPAEPSVAPAVLRPVVAAAESSAEQPSGTALPLLIAIVGPTASGKSALAVALAQRFGGEVIACDSAQVYRGFDIGTAKPTAAERNGVPHHMLDLVDSTEIFTAGEYRVRAAQVLSDVRGRGRLPILTAGTGLYLRALVDGLAEAPPRCTDLRKRLEQRSATRGTLHLHRLLQRLDPASAARIEPNDRQKLIRAVEICLLTGRPLTEVHRGGREPLAGYVTVKIGLDPPRVLLYGRIHQRIDKMIASGWRDETIAMLAQNGPSATPFEFIGYKEMLRHVQDGTPVSDTIAAIAQATRRYAKRQLTWFRKEPGVQWLAGFGDSARVVEAAVAIVAQKLSPVGQDPARGNAPGSTR